MCEVPHTLWPAPGSEDTELGVLMELEVGHGCAGRPHGYMARPALVACVDRTGAAHQKRVLPVSYLFSSHKENEFLNVLAGILALTPPVLVVRLRSQVTADEIGVE